MFRNYHLKYYNLKLAIGVIILTIMGIVVIGSANELYQTRQLMGLALGLVVMIATSIVNYSFWLTYYYLFYAGALGLLGFVLLFGDSSYGATRWIDLGFVRFQPSELAKIFLIVFFANYFMVFKEEINEKKRMLITVILMAVPLVMIMMEPDLSTTIVTFFMMSSMLFYSGLSYKIVAAFLGTAFVSVFVVIRQALRNTQGVLLGYQGDRIQAWLRPEDYPQLSYQQQNSIMAVGSGQFFGKGLYNTGVDSVKNGNYISEGQTDFIFAIVGEELGFIGSCTMIMLLLFIAYECFKTAKKAKDFSGELICIGMGALVSVQSFVNIGVVTGLLPNTGLTLPFVSYGLTSLVTLFFGIGIVLNVSFQSRKW